MNYAVSRSGVPEVAKRPSRGKGRCAGSKKVKRIFKENEKRMARDGLKKEISS